MRKIQISGAIIVALLFAGCDGPLPATIGDDPSDAGDAGGSGGAPIDAGEGGSEPDARDGSVGDDGGIEAGSAEVEVCGDGVRASSEFCDGDDLHGADCQTFGFTDGVLSCSETCNFDLATCTGVEVCFDGLDNDGDDQVDCADADCAAACTSSCAQVPEISGDGLINGNTNDKPSLLASSCLQSGADSGSELVFRVIAAQAGVLEARLTSITADHTLSIRASCAQNETEVACSNSGAGAAALENVVVQVQQAEEVFIVVDGAGANEAGAFALQTLTRPLACGDGIRDPGEKCDDHNTESDDGCSSSCEIEANEAEPNDTTITAHPYVDPVVGEIWGVNDIDMFSIAVDSGNSSLLVETSDLGDGTCANLVLDDRIEIIDTDGALIASDDDSGDGFCALATATDLAEGTYYIRVSASGVATSFPYRLRISRSP